MNAVTRRRPSTLLLATLLLVVALVAWFVTPTLVGNDDFQAVPIAQEGEEDEEPAQDEPSLEEALVDAPVETFQVFLSRDPFEPVVPPSVDGGGGDGGTGGTGGDGGDGGTGGDSDLCQTGSDSATCEGLTVTLLDVTSDANGDRIIVQVEDTLYEVTVGAIFAGSFQVLAITPPCADLLYGDDMFTLCQGDRVLK